MLLKLYSALYKDWSPLNTFYPEAEKVVVDEKSTITEPGILILWGGGDIHPSLYGRKNQGSFVGNFPSLRDQTEAKLFAQAVKANIPILGVCRGAQLGCAMSGGILVQHVEGHGMSHRITTVNGESFVSSSLHHQMMYPWAIEHKLLAWSTTPRSADYVGLSDEEWSKWPKRMYDELKQEDIVEPEFVFFPKTKCLGVQGHPEMMSPSCPHNQFMKKMIDEYLLSSPSHNLS